MWGTPKLNFVYVRTDTTKGINEGVTLLMIPRDTPGLSFGRVHDKMGYRLNLNREMFFNDCRVPVENRLGPENYGIANINSHPARRRRPHQRRRHDRPGTRCL